MPHLSRILLLSTALLLALTNPAIANTDLARLVQLIDYVGVDYRGAVENGRVLNAGEYDEMLDFTAAIVEQTGALETEQAPALAASARALATQVRAKAAPEVVAATAAGLRHAMVNNFEIVTEPRQAPDFARGERLYAANCVACHGAAGNGDGPAAVGMEPVPTNFHDAERWGQRTLFGLYSTISAGVDDTAMRGFAELSDAERWDLAFYVGRMAVASEDAAAGQAIWKAHGPAAEGFANLKTLLVTTPEEAAARFGQAGREVTAFLRDQPAVLFANGSPLAFAEDTLKASVAAYTAGNRDEAYRLAVSAYLEGFELMEHRLDAAAPQLRRAIEADMTTFRSLIRDGAPASAIEEKAGGIIAQLETASARMNGSTLSGSTAFASALIILLREGLEAILVVAALAAFLIKTGRRDGLPYLHAGWIGALLLGAATWLAAEYFIDFSGSSREITEGVAALVAMAVLFYVGFWMHSKTNARQWQQFIQGSVKKALSTGTLWGLAGLAFIAVYREVFETILFYQALWAQADAPAQGMLVSGIGTAAAILSVLAWLILRYSQRLPLRQFFSVSSIFMFVLAIVFAGKGIAALQEAGKLPIDPVNFPSVSLLGIYPSLEGLAAQASLLVLALVVLWRSRAPRHAAT